MTQGAPHLLAVKMDCSELSRIQDHKPVLEYEPWHSTNRLGIHPSQVERDFLSLELQGCEPVSNRRAISMVTEKNRSCL